MEAHREEWLAVGRSTAEADHATALAGLEKVYRAIGKEPPSTVIWMSSPLGGALAAALIGVSKSLWDQFGAQLRGQLGGQLWDQLWDQLRDQLGGQLGGQLRDQLGDKLRFAWWGAHDSAWTAWWSFAERLGVDFGLLSDGMHGWCAINRSCGWWWPYEGGVIMTDRPATLHLDAQGRLHSTTEMATRYRDGWGLYAIHGMRVPEDVVLHPEAITTNAIWSEDNAEVRRVMIEQMGWDRFVAAARLTAVDECPDPANPPHVLQLFDLPEQVYEQPVRLLLMTNASPERDGTRRRYGLTTPASIGSALEAAAWLAGLDQETYARLERAT